MHISVFLHDDESGAWCECGRGEPVNKKTAAFDHRRMENDERYNFVSDTVMYYSLHCAKYSIRSSTPCALRQRKQKNRAKWQMQQQPPPSPSPLRVHVWRENVSSLYLSISLGDVHVFYIAACRWWVCCRERRALWCVKNLHSEYVYRSVIFCAENRSVCVWAPLDREMRARFPEVYFLYSQISIGAWCVQLVKFEFTNKLRKYLTRSYNYNQNVCSFTFINASSILPLLHLLVKQAYRKKSIF